MAKLFLFVRLESRKPGQVFFKLTSCGVHFGRDVFRGFGHALSLDLSPPFFGDSAVSNPRDFPSMKCAPKHLPGVLAHNTNLDLVIWILPLISRSRRARDFGF